MNLPIDIYFTTTNYASKELIFTNFGFNVPTSAKINGISVELITSGTGGEYEFGKVYNSKTFLVKDNGGSPAVTGLIRTVQFKNFVDNSVSSITTNFGGESDLWGETLTAGVGTGVNHTNFGVMFAFTDASDGYTGYGDRPHLRILSVKMAITYSFGGYTTTVQENVLYGSKSQAKLYVLSEYVFMDDTDNMMFVRRTGPITYNTLKQKRVNKLHIRMLKGIAPSSLFTGNLYFSYCDQYKVNGANALSLWNDASTQFLIPLTNSGKQDDGSLEYVINRLGKYRIRQYQFWLLDPMPFVIIELEEEIDLLRD